MIKGRYVAVLEINFHIDESIPNLQPFDNIEQYIKREFNADLKKIIATEVDDVGTVSLEQQYADMWRAENG